jgi:RNA polymerase sigma-70 factor (ECF subfamily)
MDHDEWLAARFAEDRGHLRAVAFRILGSESDADDAVQDAWLRMSRSDTSEVANLTGWLTTVVARISLNMLQARKARREDPHGVHLAEDLGGVATGRQPEDEALLADAVGPALLVVLDSLEPAERLAFVLHDLFAVPFDDIASVLERSPAAARQLASRARRRVQGADAAGRPDRARQAEIVAAFLAASREGDFEGLLALLDPAVVLRADEATVRMGAVGVVQGASAVAETFSGRAQGARLAVIDGLPGAVWSVAGRPRVVFGFAVYDGKIVGIEMISDATTMEGMTLDLTPDGAGFAGP